MPVYNEERFVADAVRSILDQTFQNFEFIIVDDGSTDRTPDILGQLQNQDKRIRIIRQANAGITRALNTGLEATRGDFIARIDANDVALPMRFAIQAEFLTNNPDCVAVGGAIILVDEDGDTIGTTHYVHDHETIVMGLLGRVLRSGASLCHPAAMIRGDVIKSIGGYREKFPAAQDRDLWLRLSERGRLSNVNVPVICFRRVIGHGISMTKAQLQRSCAIEAIHDAYTRRGEFPPEELALHPLQSTSEVHGRIRLAIFASAHGYFQTARKHALRALSERPWDRGVWYGVAKILLRQVKAKTQRQKVEKDRDTAEYSPVAQ